MSPNSNRPAASFTGTRTYSDPSLCSVASLHGRVVVITGAASAIGQRTARVLAAHGARLVLIDVVAEPLEPLAFGIRVMGGQALVFEINPIDKVRMQSIISDVIAVMGDIEIWIAFHGFSSIEAYSARKNMARLDVFSPHPWGDDVEAQMAGTAIHALRHRGGFFIHISPIDIENKSHKQIDIKGYPVVLLDPCENQAQSAQPQPVRIVRIHPVDGVSQVMQWTESTAPSTKFSFSYKDSQELAEAIATWSIRIYDSALAK